MAKATGYTQVSLELEHVSSTPKPKQKTPQGWRFTVIIGASITFIVLWVNIALLIWAQQRPPQIFDGGDDGGTSNLYTGSCSQRDKIIRWSHIAINILSTLLLGASSACMQVLSAPTRKEIDHCHSRRVWLDIGVSSFRNLRWIARRRLLLWILLGLSSIALHLV